MTICAFILCRTTLNRARRLIAYSALAISIGLAFTPSGTRAEETVWRLNVHTVQARPEAQQVMTFVDRVNARTAGRLKIVPYFNGALGIKETDVLRSIKAGSVEMSTAYPGYFGRDAPEMAAAFPQGIVTARRQMPKVMPVLRQIYEVQLKRWDAVPVAWLMPMSFDFEVYCKVPVNSLEALKTKKLRVATKDQVDTFERLGIAASIVPQQDLYLALQTGVVDCALYEAKIIQNVSLQEVTKFGSVVGIGSAVPWTVLVSKHAWETLPEDLQKIFNEEGEALWDRTVNHAPDGSEEDAAARKELTDKFGLKFLSPFSDRDVLKIKEAAEEVWAERAKDIGRDAVASREKVIAALNGPGG